MEEYGCGQCMPCRLNRRRLWTSRLMLESCLHEASFFATLTYDKEHVPHDGSVSPRDASLFLKRLRAFVSPRKVRFYCVGEYGEIGGRPHYHFALFGLRDESAIREVWKLGYCHTGLLEEASAAYIAGYVTKRMTSLDDPRLKGRHPEFARMSLRPGIGAGAMLEVARALFTKDGSMSVARDGDVASVVRADKSKWPLGRYLRSKLREEMGMDSGMPVGARAQLALERVEQLLDVADRDALEQQRVQVGLNAMARYKIAESRKGKRRETI